MTGIGDPEGRRLSARRAMHLAEAGRLIRALKVLLNRADFGSPAVVDLENAVAEREQQELQRAFGRIESRRRFRHKSGHPLQERRERIFLFLDECVRANPEPHMSNAVFAVGAVAMTQSAVERYIERANALKMTFFGTHEVTFHEPGMRNHDGLYYFESDQARQEAFDAALAGLLTESDFLAFGCAVRKTAFEEDFVRSGIDPYLPTDVYSVAIQMTLERFVDFVHLHDVPRLGKLVFESQGPREDAFHQYEFARRNAVGSTIGISAWH